jgi:hypothetical protein
MSDGYPDCPEAVALALMREMRPPRRRPASGNRATGATLH